jgi:hypothetical protein
MKKIFALRTSGNGLIAIVSGIVSSLVAEKWGPTAPFKCSFLLLFMAFFQIQFRWEEATIHSTSLHSGFKESLQLLKDHKVLMTGMIQAFFESAMYTFVFMWSPALKNSTPLNVLFGWVFSAFMVG